MLHFTKWIFFMMSILIIVLIIGLTVINKTCSTSKKSWISQVVNCVVNTQDSYQKSQEWTIETTDTPMVNLNNITGNITILGHDKPICIIKITKHGATEDSLNNVEVATSFFKEKINLTTNYLKENSRSWISYELLIPQKSICSIKNVTGAIKIKKMQNSVNAQNITGSVECSLTRLEPNIEIDLSTTTGSIDFALPKDTQANVCAKTTIGSINSDFPLVFDRTQWTGSSAHGIIGEHSKEPKSNISLDTTTGSIDIKKQ